MPRRHYFGSASFTRTDEPIPLDMKKEPKENMKLVLTEITSRSGMSAVKRMGYVNNFTKLLQSTAANSNFGFSLEEIIICLRVAVLNKYKEVRAAAVRALRYLFMDEISFSKMMKLRIDIFIVRCLDKHQSSEVERVQALRFVRKVVAVCPQLFPMSFAHCLAAIAADKSQEQDRLTRACLATMCELAVSNVQVASYCGGINCIITSVLDSQAQRMNECLVLTLLYLINNPRTRCYVRSNVGLEGILAPFTDLHYNHCIEIPDSQLREDRESRLITSKMAIATVFKTWPGIISLCKPDGSGLQSLLQIFCLPDPLIKRHIMDILMDVFRIPIPAWTEDFGDALKSIDPHQMQISWKLSEGFVAEEAQSLLPHRGNARVDLLRNYTAIVLTAFVAAGLFESLVQVITTSEDLVSVRATILLGELLHMANTFLPPECSSHTHCLPTLMNIATSFQVTRQERGRASSAVNCLDRLHQLKKRALTPYSLFLEFLTMQSKSSESGSKHKKREREKDNSMKYGYWDVDDDIIREIHVGFPEECSTIQWDVIAAMLECPSITLRKFEEIGCSGFINNLLQFYKPSSQQFCTIELNNPMAKKLSEIGLLWIDFLLANICESRQMLEEFVEEFTNCLEQAYTDVTKGILSDESLIRTTSRNYFVFFGKLSFSADGHRILGKTGVYQHYLELASMKSRDRLLKLILASLDYRRAEISRIILSKILTAATLSVRLYATKFLRALLRAKVAFFNNWGIEMLVTQLYDPDHSVAMEAADVLEEACEDEANLQYLVQLRPSLLQLGDKGWRLLTRFLSVDKGFTYLKGLGYVKPLMEQWHQKYCDEYVKWVEECLAEALTTYQKPTDGDGGYVRQSSIKAVKRHVYVPTHFFGEIVKLKSGYELLRQTGYAGQFSHTVQMFDSCDEKDILKVKTALWTLGHIGTSSWGLSILTEEEIIPHIVRMAGLCEVLTVRGTCFYVLGLIAITRQGADILKSLNWESVRHKGEDSWPVIEVKEETLPYSKRFVSSLSAATDYYRQSEEESVRYRKSPSESEEAQAKSVYDEESGVYLGTEQRPSNIYDKSSGIYLGEEDPKAPKHDEGTGSGILLRILEERIQEANPPEDQHGSNVSLSDEKSNWANEEAEVKTEPPSLLERIKKTSIPAHLMPPTESSPTTKRDIDEASNRAIKKRPSLRGDSNQRLLSRRESHPRTASNASSSGSRPPVDHDNSEVAGGNQPKSINLNSFESPLAEDSLISRILKSTSITQVSDKKETKLENEDANLSPLSSTPRSRVTPDGDEIRHMRSASGVSDASYRSISSMDTSQSFGSYRSQTSLDNIAELPLDLEKSLEKNFRERKAELNRTRSSSLNDKSSVVDPRLCIPASVRSASFSGTTDDIAQYPTHSSRQMFRSDYSFNSPSGDRRRLPSSNTEVVLLDNRTLVLKNPTKPEENGAFDNSYLDQMSVSDGLSDTASFNSRNDNVKEIGMSIDDTNKKVPKKAYSRSVSSVGSSFTPRGKRLKKSVTSLSIWSLQSAPMSPTSPDMDTADMIHSYTSFRDAHGYSALSNLRRQRSFNRDIESRIGGFNQSFTIVGPPIPETRPLSLDLTGSQTPGGSIALASPSPLEHSYGRKATSSARGNELLGLSLPVDLSDFFWVEQSTFKGSWADNFTGTSTSLMQPEVLEVSQNMKLKSKAHDMTQCLRCMDLSHTTGKPLTYQTPVEKSENFTQKPETTTSPVDQRNEPTEISIESSPSGTVLEKFLKGKRGDVIFPKELGLIKKEILRLVVNLSSAVTSKSHQQSLRSWKENLPQLFEDLCLYSQVIEQMSLYNYKLNMRRFIQGFFETVKFTQLIDQAEAVVKKQNN